MGLIRYVEQRGCTHLRLVADEQVVLHGVGNVTDEELQGAALGDPGEPHARPCGGATRLVLPGLQHAALMKYRYIIET